MKKNTKQTIRIKNNLQHTFRLMLFNLLQSFCQKKNQATLFFFIYIQETEVSTSTTTQNKSYVKKKKVMKML